MRAGFVATTYEEGAIGSVSDLASWRFAEPASHITVQGLIDEVADEIERLAGRPTTRDHCLAALRSYMDGPTEIARNLLHKAYYAVPEHRRLNLLTDPKEDGITIRMLITPVGDSLAPERDDEPAGPPVSQEDRDQAWQYLRWWREAWDRSAPAEIDKDDAVTLQPSVVRFDRHDGGHAYLANSYVAPFLVDGVTYPTVTHAYWALATSDPGARRGIAAALTAEAARELGLHAPQRPDWPVVRLAVMTRLVREKFGQYPDLATQLVATGDGRLLGTVSEHSSYWGAARDGRNWLGRILELIRSELRLSTAP